MFFKILILSHLNLHPLVLINIHHVTQGGLTIFSLSLLDQ